MKKTKKLGNQGFSLVELMVVVAIIVIVTGIFAYGYSLVSSRQVDQCAKKLQTALESSRNTTMGKLTASVSFYMNGDKVMVDKEIDSSVTKVELVNNGVKVQYVLTDGGTSSTINLGDSSSPLKVVFDRSSGSLKPQSGTTYLTEFIVTAKNGSKVLHVKIDKLTGRVSVE